MRAFQAGMEEGEVGAPARVDSAEARSPARAYAVARQEERRCWEEAEEETRRRAWMRVSVRSAGQDVRRRRRRRGSSRKAGRFIGLACGTKEFDYFLFLWPVLSFIRTIGAKSVVSPTVW
jgi:hypothetical protein